MTANDLFGNRAEEGKWFTAPPLKEKMRQRSWICVLARPRLWNTPWDNGQCIKWDPFMPLSCCPSSSGGEEVTSWAREYVTFANNTNRDNTFREGPVVRPEMLPFKSWTFIGQFKSGVGDFLWFTGWMGPFQFHTNSRSVGWLDGARKILGLLCKEFFTPSDNIMAIRVTILGRFLICRQRVKSPHYIRIRPCWDYYIGFGGWASSSN